MVTNQEWRATNEARHRQAEQTLHALQVMTTKRINERRAALATLQDRDRKSVMNRVKEALMNTFSRRRESHDSEGSGPRAKPLHRSPKRDGAARVNGRGNQTLRQAQQSGSGTFQSHRTGNR